MIDVAIICSGSRESYFKECLLSLEKEPVNICVVDKQKTLGDGRIKSYEAGVNRFVCFVDDDDVIIPGAFDRALFKIKLESNISAYYSNHLVVTEDLSTVIGRRFSKLSSPGLLQDAQMHHIVVYDRNTISPVIGYLRGVHTRDRRLLNYHSIMNGRVIGDLNHGAMWRIHSGNNHKTADIRSNPPEWFAKIEELEKDIIDKFSKIVR